MKKILMIIYVCFIYNVCIAQTKVKVDTLKLREIIQNYNSTLNLKKYNRKNNLYDKDRPKKVYPINKIKIKGSK